MTTTPEPASQPTASPPAATPAEYRRFVRAARTLECVLAEGRPRADAIGEVVRELQVSRLYAGRLIAGYPAEVVVERLHIAGLSYSVEDLRRWETLEGHPMPAVLNSLAGLYLLPSEALCG